MRYRQLSPTGDYTFGSSLLNFWIDVPDAVAQAVQTRLELWSGEWFLDVEEGTPYLISIFGKHSQTEADVTIQDRINGTQGLVDIENYSSDVDADNRKMVVSCLINTIYGPTAVELDNVSNF